jgi:hypothetical protein
MPYPNYGIYTKLRIHQISQWLREIHLREDDSKFEFPWGYFIRNTIIAGLSGLAFSFGERWGLWSERVFEGGFVGGLMRGAANPLLVNRIVNFEGMPHLLGCQGVL